MHTYKDRVTVLTLERGRCYYDGEDGRCLRDFVKLCGFTWALADTRRGEARGA